MTLHTTGIVLKIVDRGESDRLASIYTDTHGKLELFVKSGRRIQSKLSPHLEALTLASCYVVRGRLDHLAGIERVERFRTLRESLPLLGQAAWAAEIVDQLTKPDHPDRRIFDLLVSWCTTLEDFDQGEMPSRFRLAFFLRLLDHLGYRQEFDHCLLCKATNHTVWFLSVHDGGLLCRDCASRGHGGTIRCLPRGQEALRGASDEPSFRFHPGLLRELDQALARSYLDSLLGAHLYRPVAAQHFLERLETA